MSPEAKKVTLCDITTDQLTYRYHHFSIRYEFYAAEQIQTIIKTESSNFSGTRFAWTYAEIFRVRVPGRSVGYSENYW